MNAVNPIERKKDIVEGFIFEFQGACIHHLEFHAMDQLPSLLNHLRNNVDAGNGMSHSLEKKACSPATAADVEDPARNIKMRIEDSFFHREKIELTVLLQGLLTRKSFFVPHFLIGEHHHSLLPVLWVGSILHDLSEFHKGFVRTHYPYRGEIAATWRIGSKVKEVIG